MDQIRIQGLEIYAGHGVFPEENRNGQKFIVNAVLYSQLQDAGEKDDLHLSTHYGEVCHLISRCLKENTYKLIEAAAEHAATEVLLKFPKVRELELELCKPDAPISLPFANVSVRIKRGWKRAYLGIGSNLGDKRAYMEKALESLKSHEKIRNVKCSELIVTEPYGGVEQDDFLNGVIMLDTLFSPMQLLTFLHELEQDAGRERKLHWGPRTLDLDILLYEDYISDDPVLTVPHPDMVNREFVLKPLAELSPYVMHPVYYKSALQLLSELRGRKAGEEGKADENEKETCE